MTAVPNHDTPTGRQPAKRSSDNPGEAADGVSQLGETLRRAREMKGFTLEDMARQTRIRPIHLQALEAGDLESLPGPTFVMGFLRLYVKQLGLPEQETLAQFSALVNQNRGQLSFAPPGSDSRSRPAGWLVLAGVVLFVGLFMVYEKWHASTSGSGLRVETPAAPVAAPPEAASVAAPEVVATEAPAEAGAQVVSAPSEAPAPVATGTPVKPQPAVQQQAAKPAPGPETRQAAKPAPEAAAKPESPAPPPPRVEERQPVVLQVQAAADPAGDVGGVVAEPSWETLGGQTLNADAGGEPVIFLAHEEVWLQIQERESGQVVKDMMLKQGERFRVYGGARFKAIVGNAGGVSLRLGDQEMPPLGSPGKVVRNLVLDPDILRTR